MKRFFIAAAIAGGLYANDAHAQGHYFGEIIMMASNFCPMGTIPADGKPISMKTGENNILASVIGTTYGGNYATELGTPNLQDALTVGGKTVPVMFCIVRDGDTYPSRP